MCPRVSTFHASPYTTSQGFRHGTFSMSTPMVMMHSPAMTSMKKVPLISKLLCNKSSASSKLLKALCITLAPHCLSWVSSSKIVGSFLS